MGVQKLEKIVVSDKWIEKFKQDHISRAFEVRLKGGLIKPRHPHRNHPYCNICDMDYEGWDVGYRIYVGGHAVVYHTECIEANWGTKKVRNILDSIKPEGEISHLIVTHAHLDHYEAVQSLLEHY